jgi:tripartite-type tricarboxylate transporter receptor subunit TctC
MNHGGGSAGYQLMNEALNERAGIDIRNVPFKGASEALTGVVSNTVDLAFADITASTELIKSGKLRALAVASDRRAAVLPSLPHMGEAGLPGFGAYVWVGAMVAVKTPKAEADKLATLLAQIERMPETREFYEKLGAETMQGGAEEMRRFQAQEIEQWRRLAIKAKVQQE